MTNFEVEILEVEIEERGFWFEPEASS